MKTLIIAPHPDDELLGCFSKIINRDKLTILYISSGRDNEIDKREAAVKEILGHLNIKQIFLREGDANLVRPQNAQKFIKDIIKKENPDEIYFPYKEKCHKLHDEIYDIMKEIKTKAIKKTYSVYGCWSIGKIFAIMLNKFTTPLGILMGFNPHFKYKPYETYVFDRHETLEKNTAMQKYRNMVGEKVRRIFDYQEEHFKYA